MSETANDFMDFYKPSKHRETFSILKQVDLVVKLMSKQLTLQNITLSVEGCEDIYTTGFASEFKQVVLNIINNAKDALKERQIQNAKIAIEVKKVDKKAILIICDNAGGIPKELMPDIIFEPFFSTKGENGTGIGLSLSKSIIEENMSGYLRVENINDGACFIIELPLSL